MTIKTETCTSTLHRDMDGRWFVWTKLQEKAFLEEKLQRQPDPERAQGAEVEVNMVSSGSVWTVTDLSIKRLLPRQPDIRNLTKPDHLTKEQWIGYRLKQKPDNSLFILGCWGFGIFGVVVLFKGGWDALQVGVIAWLGACAYSYYEQLKDICPKYNHLDNLVSNTLENLEQERSDMTSKRGIR